LDLTRVANVLRDGRGVYQEQQPAAKGRPCRVLHRRALHFDSRDFPKGPSVFRAPYLEGALSFFFHRKRWVAGHLVMGPVGNSRPGFIFKNLAVFLPPRCTHGCVGRSLVRLKSRAARLRLHCARLCVLRGCAECGANVIIYVCVV